MKGGPKTGRKIALCYWVWRRSLVVPSPGTTVDPSWTRTTYSVMARSDREAEAKTRRKFAGCGFGSMSLVAALGDPNKPQSPKS